MAETKGRAHGTPRRYQDGCKCDPCTDQNTMRNEIARQKRAGRVPSVHNASTYRNWNCKCDICSEANRVMMSTKQNAAGKGRNARKEWTSAELEIVTEKKDGRRYARTALEAALMLGRSVAAVNRQRTLRRVNSPREISAPAGEFE